jgi:ABC-type glycerol-3-phosphate transport system substrate-binding protein
MRWSGAVAAALLLATGAAACSGDSSSSLPTPSKAFCQAAYDYDTNLPKLIGKINKQTDLVAKLAETAPKDIADDAEIYLDAMKRRAAGDTSVVDNPKIERAVDNVNRRASDGCELFKQNQDGSGGI